jgi:predicted  nucleic acid-binding Zn-ribbon protein
VEAVDDEIGSLRKKIARFKETTKKTREELEQRRKELVKAERAEADALREYSGSGVPLNDGDVPSGPYKDLLDQMEELNAQLDKTDVEIKQLNISNDSNRATRLSLLAQEEEVGNELKKMEDIKEKRRDFLRQSDPDTYKAMQWIYNYGGQSELKEKPYDPIMVEVTATHERYGRVIENAIPFASWKVG